MLENDFGNDDHDSRINTNVMCLDQLSVWQQAQCHVQTAFFFVQSCKCQCTSLFKKSFQIIINYVSFESISFHFKTCIIEKEWRIKVWYASKWNDDDDNTIRTNLKCAGDWQTIIVVCDVQLSSNIRYCRLSHIKQSDCLFPYICISTVMLNKQCCVIIS